MPILMRDNIFQNCALPVVERSAGLWKGCTREGNLYSISDSEALKPVTVARTVPSK